MNGVITTENVYEKKDELLKQINEYKITDAVKSVTNPETRTYGLSLIHISEPTRRS